MIDNPYAIFLSHCPENDIVHLHMYKCWLILKISLFLQEYRENPNVRFVHFEVMSIFTNWPVRNI